MKTIRTYNWKALLKPEWFIVDTIAFILLFFLFEGYQFGVGNQLVFLPVIQSLGKYPHLANDFGVSARAFYHPFFNISMAWLSQFVQLPILFFIIQTGLIGLLYTTTHKLTAFFFDSRYIYWGGVVLMLLWAQQGADDNVLWTNRLEAQYLVWPFILTAFSAYLNSQWGRAGLWLGVVCLFHLPLGVISGVVLSTLALLSENQRQARNLLRLWSGGAVLGIPLFLYSFRGVFIRHFLIGPEFITFAALRASHHMIFNLRLASLFTFLALIPCVILKVAAWRGLFSETQQIALKRLAHLQSVLLVFGAAQYADYYLHIGILSRLQFLRLMPFVYLTGVLFLAFFLLQMLRASNTWPKLLCCLFIFLIGPRLITYQSLRENWIYVVITALAMGLTLLLKNNRTKNPSLLLLVLFFPLAWCARTTSISPQSSFSIHPAPLMWDTAKREDNPWVDICQKAGRAIPESDLVLSPPYMNGFAYFSKRKTLVEFKSNGAHKETYLEWLKRLTLAVGGNPLQDCAGMSCLDKIKQEYNHLEPDKIDEIIRLYEVAFFVTESSKVYPYENLYTNGTYKLYRLRPSSPSGPSANRL